MRAWIQGEPALDSGSGISEFIGSQRMGELMNRDGGNKASENHEEGKGAGRKEDAYHGLFFEILPDIIAAYRYGGNDVRV